MQNSETRSRKPPGRNSTTAALLALLLFACAPASAVPMVLRYDARLLSNGALFSGTGQFKFAIINPAGSTTHWSHDGTSTAGSEPAGFVSRAVSAGNASVLLGEAPMIPINPAVFSSQPALRLRVWFNDGTRGFQRLVPDQIISPVPTALAAAQADTLVDGAVTTDALAAGAVTSVKIAADSVTASTFAPGAVTGAKLAPGAAQAAVANAIGILTPGSGVMSATADNPTLLANGFVYGGTFERPEYWAPQTADFYRRGGHRTAWTGTEWIVWGGTGENSEFTASGLGWIYTPATGAWRRMSNVGAPSNRKDPVSVCTGTKFIVWGGQSADPFQINVYFNNGAVYDIATDTWSAMASTGAPSARTRAGAVWTGTRMILFGGIEPTLNDPFDGGIYDPAANTWQPLPTTNAPWPRHSFEPVWSGTEMYVFGGNTDSANGGVSRMGRFNPATGIWTPLPDVPAPDTSQDEYTVGVWTGTELVIWGARLMGPAPVHHRYSPITNTWTVMSTAGEPDRAGRTLTEAVWTGSEMIVFGHRDASTGAVTLQPGRYNPTTDTWSPVSSIGEPPPRVLSMPIWTGTEMLLFGGYDYDGLHYADAYGYAPAGNAWRNIETPAFPADSRQDAASLWTGSDFYVWGGRASFAEYSDGGRYSAAEGRWYAINAPLAMARYSPSMVWTGSQVLIFGGKSTNTFNDLLAYTPATGTWATVQPAPGSPLPTERYEHGAVWTGTEMIVWGGKNSLGTALADGWRFNPVTRMWTALPAANAPSARSDMHAFWTGQKAIFWGGIGNAGAPVGGGALYDPAFNVWTAIPDVTVGAGAGAQEWRSGAVWTGTEMIVWGGQFGTDGVNTGARFNPSTLAWTDLPTTGAPSARLGHVAVWDGSRMFVMCGRSKEAAGRIDYRDGGTYTPATNRWEPIAEGPLTITPRAYAHGAWTGTELVVTNGLSSNDRVNDWFRFIPRALSHVFLKP